MRVLDLFCGLGGWSQAFKDRGHNIVTVDNNIEFNPDICKDVMILNQDDFNGYKFDVILASPPCTEFSKSMMPDSWNKNRSVNPDTVLIEKTLELIRMLKPRYWVIENVQGARKYFKPLLGEYVKKVGSRYLWGVFPDFKCKSVYGKWRLPPGKNRVALRSLIPYDLSLAVCIALEDVEGVKKDKGTCKNWKNGSCDYRREDIHGYLYCPKNCIHTIEKMEGVK